VNRADRGPLLLILAALLLFLTIIAYLINEAQEERQRNEAILQGREALRVQRLRAIEDRKLFQSDSNRVSRERDELRTRQDAIIKALGRIENKLSSQGGR
jgi:hypothetical protein